MLKVHIAQLESLHPSTFYKKLMYNKLHPGVRFSCNSNLQRRIAWTCTLHVDCRAITDNANIGSSSIVLHLNVRGNASCAHYCNTIWLTSAIVDSFFCWKYTVADASTSEGFYVEKSILCVVIQWKTISPLYSWWERKDQILYSAESILL